MALSASTPKHLYKIGLIETFNPSDIESDYNFLMRTALEKVFYTNCLNRNSMCVRNSF